MGDEIHFTWRQHISERQAIAELGEVPRHALAGCGFFG